VFATGLFGDEQKAIGEKKPGTGLPLPGRVLQAFGGGREEGRTPACSMVACRRSVRALAHGRRLAAVDNGAADNLRARVDEK
jgi:hypothetical protein